MNHANHSLDHCLSLNFDISFLHHDAPPAIDVSQTRGDVQSHELSAEPTSSATILLGFFRALEWLNVYMSHHFILLKWCTYLLNLLTEI